VTTLPKIDRRGWLALWMQRRRRKRLASHKLLPAPVLRPVYPGLLQWDWNLANPYRWNVWQSWDGGASWMLVEDYWTTGAGRQFAPDGGHELYFIVAVDEFGREITEHSNQARPDDALMPAAWISVDAAAAFPAPGQIGVSDVGDVYSNGNFGGWVFEYSDDGESWQTHQVVVQGSGGSDCAVSADYGFYYRAWARGLSGNRISEYSAPFFYPAGSSGLVLSYDSATQILSWEGETPQNWGLYFSDYEAGPFERAATLGGETYSANAGDYGEGYYYVQPLLWDEPNGAASNIVNVIF
jgi:hypothetical protein